MLKIDLGAQILLPAAAHQDLAKGQTGGLFGRAGLRHHELAGRSRIGEDFYNAEMSGHKGA